MLKRLKSDFELNSPKMCIPKNEKIFEAIRDSNIEYLSSLDNESFDSEIRTLSCIYLKLNKLKNPISLYLALIYKILRV